MSKSKSEIKSIADLPHYKEEFGAILKEMGLGEVTPQPSLKINRGAVPEETHVILLDYERS